jgi:hypothetical protein
MTTTVEYRRNRKVLAAFRIPCERQRKLRKKDDMLAQDAGPKE